MALDELSEKVKDFIAGSVIVITIIGSIASLRGIVEKKRLSALVWHVDHRFMDMSKIGDVYTHVSASRYNTIFLPQEDFDFNIVRKNLEELRPYPIMLNVFTSVELNGNPYKLDIPEIEECIFFNDIRALRFHEVISWYAEHGRDLPNTYIEQILNFCKEHKIFLFWNEWDINAFEKIKTMIKGYEDYVMPSYETIGQFEPIGGFYAIMGNKYWGTCVTSWYWQTKGKGDQKDMPIELMIQFSKQARDLGAVMIQYEPYSYFFEDTTSRATLKPLIEAI